MGIPNAQVISVILFSTPWNDCRFNKRIHSAHVEVVESLTIFGAESSVCNLVA